MKRFRDYINFQVGTGYGSAFRLTPELLRGIQEAFDDLAAKIEEVEARLDRLDLKTPHHDQ